MSEPILDEDYETSVCLMGRVPVKALGMKVGEVSFVLMVTVCFTDERDFFWGGHGRLV